MTDCKAENEKLMGIVLEYIERYGLTDKAREFFMQADSKPAD
ncbi:hypothetical protein [uncultured Roseovarius sp.]|nr:hypothetical protein [uncultured Roseovarius sp.]